MAKTRSRAETPICRNRQAAPFTKDAVRFFAATWHGVRRNRCEGRTKMDNRKRNRILLTITLVAVALLSAVIFSFVRRASDEMEQYSFGELTAATKRTAKDYYDTIQTDKVILSAMADLIALQKQDDLDAVLQIMNSCGAERTFISYVELLLPDGRMLH